MVLDFWELNLSSLAASQNQVYEFNELAGSLAGPGGIALRRAQESLVLLRACVSILG